MQVQSCLRHGDHRISTFPPSRQFNPLLRLYLLDPSQPLSQYQFRARVIHSQQAITPSPACHFYGRLHARSTPVSSAMRKPSTSQGASSLMEAIATTQVTQKASTLTSKARTRQPTSSIFV